MANSSAVVKLHYNDEIRRFTLARTSTWDELKQKVYSLLQIPATTELVLTYADEEGDLVVLASDGEVAELLTFSNSTIRLHTATKVPVVSSPAANSVDASSFRSTDALASASKSEPTNDKVAEQLAAVEENLAGPSTLVDQLFDSELLEKSLVEELAHLQQQEATSSQQLDALAAEKPVLIQTEKSEESQQPETFEQPQQNEEPTQPTQSAPSHTAKDIYKDLERVWATYKERNQDLFEQERQLRKEYIEQCHREVEAQQREAEAKQRELWKARLQALKEHQHNYCRAQPQFSHPFEVYIPLTLDNFFPHHHVSWF